MFDLIVEPSPEDWKERIEIDEGLTEDERKGKLKDYREEIDKEIDFIKEKSSDIAFGLENEIEKINDELEDLECHDFSRVEEVNEKKEELGSIFMLVRKIAQSNDPSGKFIEHNLPSNLDWDWWKGHNWFQNILSSLDEERQEVLKKIYEMEKKILRLKVYDERTGEMGEEEVKQKLVDCGEEKIQLKKQFFE